MTDEEIPPAAQLAPFVQCFWTSEVGDQDTMHTILPDGCFDLIAEVEAGKVTSLKLTGIWSIPIHVHSRARQRRMAVRFRPLAAELLNEIALPTLYNTAMSLPLTFWGIDAVQGDDFAAFCSQVQVGNPNHIWLEGPVRRKTEFKFSVNVHKKITSD